MGLSIGKLIDTPPVWLLFFALLVWGVGDMLPGTALGLGALRAIGTGLVIFGCLLIVMAAWQFRVHKTTIVPHLRPANIITTGVYTLSRNPIYLADATILTGLCLRWDVLPGLVLVPVFMWLIQRRFIAGEEKRLMRAFPGRIPGLHDKNAPLALKIRKKRRAGPMYTQECRAASCAFPIPALVDFFHTRPISQANMTKGGALREDRNTKRDIQRGKSRRDDPGQCQRASETRP